MKTKLSILLGTVLCLFGTLTTTHAAGKGGGKPGGGGGSTPEGTIYYMGPIPGLGYGALMTSMNPDGSNQSVVGQGQIGGLVYGRPSLNQHSGLRWFLGYEPFSDHYYPDGSQRREISVVREDYDPNSGNVEQTHVLLTDDLTFQAMGQAHWLLGDTFVSIKGRRWSSADPDATVVAGGVYVLPLVFDADDNIIGLGEPLTTPTIPVPLVQPEFGNPGGYPEPDMIHYAWDPSGTKIVHTKSGDPYGVWVTDLLSGTETKISSHPGHKPEWSPDGNSIVYGVSGGFVTIKPNGKRLTWILQKTSTWEFYSAYWSPRSDQLVFYGQSYASGSRNTDMFRIDANGQNLVQLTDTPAPSDERTNDQSGGWR